MLRERVHIAATWRAGLIALSVGLTACGDATAPASVVRSANADVRNAKPVPPPTVPVITVTALGSLPTTVDNLSAPIGLALNNGATRAETRVVGYTAYGDVLEYPFTWTLDGGIAPLAVAEPGRHGWPMGVSDNGIIVGEAGTNTGNRAFVVTPHGAMSYLPGLPGMTYSGAAAISANGSCIAGTIQTSSGTTRTSYVVLWKSGQVEIVSVGSASGVTNDCLVVAGNYQGRATIWRFVAGAWNRETLPSAGAGSLLGGSRVYSEATDVSPSGEYVAGRRLDGTATFAVVWRRTAGAWSAADMAGQTISAFGVDNAGRAVGNDGSGQPTVWVRGSTGSYTGVLLPPLERSTGGWAAAINELGQISGRSHTRHGPQPVLWTIQN